MSFVTDFETRLPKNLRTILNQLDTPFAIQEYLDSMPYIGEERDAAAGYQVRPARRDLRGRAPLA